MFPNPQEALPLPTRPLASLQDAPRSLLRNEQEINAQVERIEQFAAHTFARAIRATCALTDAQFVIARTHGFRSWPTFVSHLESLSQTRPQQVWAGSMS